jgi:MATE family multidrug resistance protein
LDSAPFPFQTSGPVSNDKRPQKGELRAVVRLSAPVALTQVGLMMTGVIDTLMVSRLGVAELAASALGNMWQWTFLSLGLGIVMGIDPLISQTHGRGDGPGTALALQRGVVLALAISVPLTIALFFTREGLVALGQDPALAELADRYNRYKTPTIACFLVYSALRQYLQGRGIMAPATWVMWLGNVLHVLLNWGLIFGRFGMPALGLEGAAIASSITTLALLLGLIVWVQGFGLHREAWRRWDRASFSLPGVLQAARLGVPVGAQFASEAWAFSIATLMAGRLGSEAVGAHQIVLNMAALTFMVPVGISQGTSVRVGNLVGRGDPFAMRRAAAAGMLLAATFMGVSAACFLFFRHELPRLFTSEPAILSIAASILPVAAAFQLADGAQVVAAGILRGLGRTDASAAANVLGFYVLGLPLAYVAAFVWQYGLVGIWCGLALGLLAVAVALLLRVLRTVRRPLAELTVDVRA